MIIVQLQGGLGNQMFQYAVGRYLSIYFNTDLYFDFEFLERINHELEFTPRQYELHIFHLSVQPVDRARIYKYFIRPTNMLEKIVGKVFRQIDGFRSVYETNPTYRNNIHHAGKHCYLIGYWQNEKYFKPIESVIRNDFTFRLHLSNKELHFLNEIKHSNSVAVHVRKGDYTKYESLKKYYFQCDAEYYQRAIYYIQQHISDARFYFFSDEPFWIENNIQINFPFQIVQTLHAGTDMFLMSQCKHNIIANSTFSWWAAWLNNHVNKIVIAPKIWYNTKPDNPALDSWIKI